MGMRLPLWPITHPIASDVPLDDHVKNLLYFSMFVQIWVFDSRANDRPPDVTQCHVPGGWRSGKAFQIEAFDGRLTAGLS
jgi:hypothetical protein